MTGQINRQSCQTPEAEPVYCVNQDGATWHSMGDMESPLWPVLFSVVAYRAMHVSRLGRCRSVLKASRCLVFPPRVRSEQDFLAILPTPPDESRSIRGLAIIRSFT